MACGIVRIKINLFPGGGFGHVSQDVDFSLPEFLFQLVKSAVDKLAVPAKLCKTIT